LSKTFVPWPKNIEQTLKNEEDKLFLKSMQTDRVATFGSFDQVLANKTKRKN